MKNLILYIIKFKEAEFLKIGITTNILKRLDQINSSIDQEINFKESIIIDSENNSDIRLLERNLLRISINDSIEIETNIKITGATEFRKNCCFEGLMNFIELQKTFKIKFTIYNGIDTCGNYTHSLPKTYFPFHIKTTGLSLVLIEDLKSYCKKKKIEINNFYNQMLFDKAKELGIDREDDNDDSLKNVYQA